MIRPREQLDIGRMEHNPEKMRAVYALGRELRKEKRNEIREFLR